MALIVNHNMAAQTAARNLSTIYDRLSTSIQRLSSGLRINSAADDAAGLAIREMMRADIAAMNQGIRNIADAISMIQTADGALSVIDEKLIRMKELAEQAATGTYTTAQREIINSEYQAMAAEIDRIANATNFNGIKLLDGTVNNQHGGQGIKIHFGVSNDSSEDYYYVNIGDARATSSTGLRIGGDGKNDIWGQGAAGAAAGTGAGCCSGGFKSLDQPASEFNTAGYFAYGYNWDGVTKDETALLSAKYVAGRYTVGTGDSLQDLINKVNAGTQSRVAVTIGATGAGFAAQIEDSGYVAVCLGDEAFYFGNATLAANHLAQGKTIEAVTTGFTAADFATAINESATSKYWAMQDAAGSDTFYVFLREGGDNNRLLACEVGFQSGLADPDLVGSALDTVSFTNVETGVVYSAGTNFSLGGEHWGTMSPTLSTVGGTQVWNTILNGRDVGAGRDLWIAETSSEVLAPGSALGVAQNLNRLSFTEIQNASDAGWMGAEVRSQSSAQEALDAISESINTKDKIRAALGAVQNRLENTMSNLTIQAENLQASESRISDVDVAAEMTEFTRNNVLAQAATAMLAQANSLSQLALSLMM
jgi:flagellin